MSPFRSSIGMLVLCLTTGCLDQASSNIGDESGMDPDFVERLKVVDTVPEAAARVFMAARPAMAVATHLGQAPELTPELEARVRRGYAGRFVVGEDLMTFIIGDTVEVVRGR